MAKRQNASLFEFSHGIRQSLCRVLKKVSRGSPKLGGGSVAKSTTWKKS
jgi:hypothetical protein